jgi:hypothetical protein
MRFHINDDLINYSAQVLAHTDDGMTWAQIAKFFRKKSSEYHVAAPFVNTLFPSNLANRRDGFIRNLRAFSGEQQFILLNELCDLTNKKVNSTPLKKMLLHHRTKSRFTFAEINHNAL